jgi:hypothetical protein
MDKEDLPRGISDGDLRALDGEGEREFMTGKAI